MPKGRTSMMRTSQVRRFRELEILNYIKGQHVNDNKSSKCYHKLHPRGSRQLRPGSTDTTSLEALAKNPTGSWSGSVWICSRLCSPIAIELSKDQQNCSPTYSTYPRVRALILGYGCCQQSVEKTLKSTPGAAIQPLPSIHLMSVFLKTNSNRKFWATRDICATAHFAWWFALTYPSKHMQTACCQSLLLLPKVHPCLGQLDWLGKIW